jgi:hypothetical protein
MYTCKRMWRARLVAAVLTVAACVARPAVADTPVTLRPAECPRSSHEYGACLPVEIYVFDDPSRVIYTRQAPRDVGYADRIRQVVNLEGILAGGAPRRYRLKLPSREDGEFNPEVDIGPLAYLGRSERNRPIVLTDRGPLEITTPSIDFSLVPALILAREEDMAVRGRFYEAYGAPFVVTRGGEVGAWNATRKVCVSAPRRLPGRLVIVSQACRAAGVAAGAGAAYGNTASASDIDEAVGRKFFKEDTQPNHVFISRVPGTGFIVIAADWDYCC